MAQAAERRIPEKGDMVPRASLEDLRNHGYEA